MYNLLKLHLKKYQVNNDEGLGVEILNVGKILRGYLRIEKDKYILTSRYLYNYIKNESISIYVPRRNRTVGKVKVRVHKNDKNFIL